MSLNLLFYFVSLASTSHYFESKKNQEKEFDEEEEDKTLQGKISFLLSVKPSCSNSKDI